MSLVKPVPNTTFIAQTWRRILAYFVDQFIVGVFFIPVWMEISRAWIQQESAEISVRGLLLCLALAIAYQVVFLKMMGATIGKLLFGLRVVRARTRQELTFMQCLLRVLTDHLAIFFSQGLRVLALFRFDRRHVSDWVAETQVVQLRENPNPARPRAVLASLLFIYLSFSGFFSTYQLVQRCDWTRQTITLHPIEDESPESLFEISGSD